MGHKFKECPQRKKNKQIFAEAMKKNQDYESYYNEVAKLVVEEISAILEEMQAKPESSSSLGKNLFTDDKRITNEATQEWNSNVKRIASDECPLEVPQRKRLPQRDAWKVHEKNTDLMEDQHAWKKKSD